MRPKVNISLLFRLALIIIRLFPFNWTGYRVKPRIFTLLSWSLGRTSRSLSIQLFSIELLLIFRCRSLTLNSLRLFIVLILPLNCDIIITPLLFLLLLLFLTDPIKRCGCEIGATRLLLYLFERSHKKTGQCRLNYLQSAVTFWLLCRLL